MIIGAKRIARNSVDVDGESERNAVPMRKRLFHCLNELRNICLFSDGYGFPVVGLEFQYFFYVIEG